MTYTSVQELFSRIAAEFGSQVAVDHASHRSVTYAELEAQSNRLANFLLEGGVGRGSMVGIFSDDPINIITSILGVLKAGAVFVPLDPTFPEQRLQALATQVHSEWHIVEKGYLRKLRRVWDGSNSEASVICIDQRLDETAARDDAAGEMKLLRYAHYDRTTAPGVESDPEAPCSIYFSSGSTGKPKAILGRLKGIDHFMRWEIAAVQARAGTRVSQLASPSFDGFLKDVFVPLCAGGVVCAPASREVILDAWSLADWLDYQRVEVLHCVPSLFRSLLKEGLNERYFEALRYVVLTGEPLYPADVKRWYEVFGERIKLLNIYGTTETSLSKFHYEVKREDVERPSIPVGKPIKGAAVMIINSRGQLCREETVGEIYIRTPYRSHGYYGEPELTKEVFIQNPFTDDANDIVHKTGDYGRLLKGGDLEILGRRDQQVKVRGVRIELGEIENQLRTHESVADVTVVDRDDGEGNKFLVAYVSLMHGGGIDQLRQYLGARLPATMLPSAYVELDHLPRTLNGKIDRKALPALEELQENRQLEAAPLTPIEEIVAGIWSNILRLKIVGRTDNFFNLGGHSLLMTTVLSRIRESFKVELPIRSLFEAPTVAEFSELIQEQVSASRQSELAPITRVSRDGELPLSYSQQRMWFLEQLATGTSALHITVGVRLSGILNAPALEQTFGEIIRRHESLRTVFPAVDRRPVQIIEPPRSYKLKTVDLSMLDPTEREDCANRIAESETSREFDLAKGPLVRLTLLRIGQHERILICQMHHIIGDGQSFDVIIEEMNRLYTPFTKGQPSPLFELNVQYNDYAAWQRQWLQGELLENRLDYWRKQLEDAPRNLSLPQRRARPRVQRFKGGKHYLTIASEHAEALRGLSRREAMTTFMTALSAFVLLIKQFTGDEDILVGTTYANRERAEAEQIIGILANTLVLRVNLSGALTFADVMRRVREVCLDAYNNQVPPELLREDLARSGDERERLFDVWFQLEREKQERFEANGLEVSRYLGGQEDSRFELSMAVGEREHDFVCMLEYDNSMFTSQTTAQMLEDYYTLLRLMVTDPEVRLSTVSLTTKQESKQLSAAFAGSLE